jgi:hypothetical protein
MMEAKKLGATETEIRVGEVQAWQAAFKCSLYEGGHLIWYMTCIGTAARIWIYDPTSEFPIPFLQGLTA